MTNATPCSLKTPDGPRIGGRLHPRRDAGGDRHHRADRGLPDAQLQLDTLAANVETFASDVGRYPTDKEGLDALVAQPGSVEGWTGPYVRDRKMLNDPWGRPILYVPDPNGRAFEVESLGADGKLGGQGVDRDLQSPQAPSNAPASSAAATS